MAEVTDCNTRHPWLGRGRAAALGFGLGATLALSPFVWAENPPTINNPSQATPAAPETMTSPIALMQGQSFAPLVKKVSPAVVNISVTQNAAVDATAEEPEAAPSPGFPNIARWEKRKFYRFLRPLRLIDRLCCPSLRAVN